MRFEGALHALGVLNHSSRCIIVLRSVRYASMNLLCCLAAPRLAGASLDFILGSLDSSLQYTGELSHADVLRLGVLQGELPRQACGRDAEVTTEALQF